MKTFICALAVICILTGAVVLNMLSINRSVDEMIDIASSVPGHDGDIADDFSDVAEKVEKLWELWDKKITKLAYTVGYDDINRADDAMSELYTSYITKSKEGFITARLKFIDAVRRIKQMENFKMTMAHSMNKDIKWQQPYFHILEQALLVQMMDYNL